MIKILPELFRVELMVTKKDKIYNHTKGTILSTSEFDG
jgi:hypothetical protein